MSSKICFISLKHDFDDNRIFHKEARTLAQAGYKVVHIAPGNGKSFCIQGVQIEFYVPSSCKLRTLINVFRLYRQARAIDAEYYHCNEIETWFIGCMIKLISWKKRVIFDVHEHYPSRFREPHFPRWAGTIGTPLIHMVFRLLVPLTDHVIFAKRSIAEDFPDAKKKHTFLFNYAPLWLRSRRIDDISAAVRGEFNGDPVAIHIGALSRARGWPQLIKALSMMKNKKLQVLCIGQIMENETTLVAEAEKLGVADRIRIKESMPYETMFDYLLCSNIGLMLYQPGIQNHVFAFPIKLYDYMLAALPVVAPDFSVEVVPVILEEECGLLVNPANPHEIAQSLDWLCENKEAAKDMGRKGREAVIRRYNWETEEHKLINAYALLEKKNSKKEPKSKTRITL